MWRFPRRILPGMRFYRPGPTEFGQLPDLKTASSFEPKAIRAKESQRAHLINAFRRYGYLAADLDLLGLKKPVELPELDPKRYGQERELAEKFKSIYCGPIAIEFMHINDEEERQWLASNFEESASCRLTNEERKKLCLLMDRCENFDYFLALKFPTVKRYGSEGAEAMFGFFQELFNSASNHRIQQIFMGIAHRGRLNLLNEMMSFPTVQMFRKMKGRTEFPDEIQGAGDVLSHLTSSFDHLTPTGSRVHISMLPNPSHLEAVNPVAMGKARARARTLQLGDYSTEKEAKPGDGVLCVLIHGDGAFTGQGITWESLALSDVPHFRLGGTVHLITNNQIAFTAESAIGRSTHHCTDVTKAFEFPVLHVNGDYPEELIRATRLALAYREKFRKDIFINLICYRRWGHNELDDPSFTQPLMYQTVEARPHAMLVDQKTDETHIPLNSIHPEQKNFLEVVNNLLSEEAIMGFEYGFSLDNPCCLCVWEAQFGDFFNGAQIIIDTFVASGESKWLTQSGLTLLLPHGYDGAGPEHSSCRVERFLQLCDSREDQQPPDGENINLRIVNPTTAAQYFHLLRRQLIPNYRKPLIVVAPKILLRHPKAASQLADFQPGTYFKEVIDDGMSGKEKIEKIVFVSGKFWLDVERIREEKRLQEKVAIIRLESLCPFPVEALQTTMKLYPKARDFIWAQEEPRNAGGWSFVKPRFAAAMGVELRFAGRPEQAWMASAIAERHAAEREKILQEIFS